MAAEPAQGGDGDEGGHEEGAEGHHPVGEGDRHRVGGHHGHRVQHGQVRHVGQDVQQGHQGQRNVDGAWEVPTKVSHILN